MNAVSLVLATGLLSGAAPSTPRPIALDASVPAVLPHDAELPWPFTLCAAGELTQFASAALGSPQLCADACVFIVYEQCSGALGGNPALTFSASASIAAQCQDLCKPKALPAAFDETIRLNNVDQIGRH